MAAFSLALAELTGPSHVPPRGTQFPHLSEKEVATVRVPNVCFQPPSDFPFHTSHLAPPQCQALSPPRPGPQASKGSWCSSIHEITQQRAPPAEGLAGEDLLPDLRELESPSGQISWKRHPTFCPEWGELGPSGQGVHVIS